MDEKGFMEEYGPNQAFEDILTENNFSVEECWRLDWSLELIRPTNINAETLHYYVDKTPLPDEYWQTDSVLDILYQHGPTGIYIDKWKSYEDIPEDLIQYGVWHVKRC